MKLNEEHHLPIQTHHIHLYLQVQLLQLVPRPVDLDPRYLSIMMHHSILSTMITGMTQLMRVKTNLPLILQDLTKVAAKTEDDLEGTM